MYDPRDSIAPSPGISRISSEIYRLAPTYGYVVVDNVVFTQGLVSVTVDHFVIDRFGVLIIDAEAREGAVISGADTDNQWIATSGEGQQTGFRNPLFTNTGNENLVKQGLAEYMINLESNQIRSAVVFAGADVSALSLVEVNAAKVKPVERIAEIFDWRYSHPPNAGQLTAPDVDRIVEVARTLAMLVPPDKETGSWHEDPAVVATARSALAPPPPTRAPDSQHITHELAGHHAGVSEGPSMRAALLTVATIFLILLTLAAGVIFLPQLQSGSPLAWTIALVLVVALGEIIAANIAAVPHNSAKRGGRMGRGLRFGGRLLLDFLFIAIMWVLIAGGSAAKLGERIAAEFEPPLQRVTSIARTKTDQNLMVAKKQLQAVAPEVYANVKNLDQPVVKSGSNGTLTYTWTYTQAGTSVTKTYSLTIDSKGNVIDK